MKSSQILKILVIVILLCLMCWPSEASNSVAPSLENATDRFSRHPKPPPEASMSTPQIIKYHGYPLEEHHVTTADGYILTLFRIPHGKVPRNTSHSRPVILQHGLLTASDSWFLVKPQNILPYLLAEEGYDVWLGNCRGSNYSLSHKKLSQYELKFWKFSFHEMGLYDVPAFIDYILATTGWSELSWVGHSMGTTMFFVAMDRHPELQSKVNRMVALAPAAYYTHMTSALRLLALVPSHFLQAYFDVSSGGRLLPVALNRLLLKYGPLICAKNVPRVLCYNFISLVTGYDPAQTTNETAAMVKGHIPSVASSRTLAHYIQFTWTGVFAEFGIGPKPIYNLTLNRVPTLAIYANNDKLVSPKDALRVILELGNVVDVVLVNDTAFSHLDFLTGKDVKERVYDKCLHFLSS